MKNKKQRNQQRSKKRSMKARERKIKTAQSKHFTAQDKRDLHKSSFQKKYCLAKSVDCSNKIINAHTISKKWLKNIANQNKAVYIFDLEVKREGNFLKLRPKGIGNVSTFYGFCSHHDTSLFSIIENDNFTGSNEQCNTLFYRCLAKEFYLKKASKELLSKAFEKASSSLSQTEIPQALVNNFLESRQQESSSQDISKPFKKSESMMSSENFDELNYCIIELDSPPEVMTSGAILPEFDFSGSELQFTKIYEPVVDENERLDILTCSAFSDGPDNGYIVFTWLNDATYSKKFVESLLESKDISNNIVRFIFAHFENIAFNPSWWDALSEKKKRDLFARFIPLLDSDQRNPHYLTEGDEKYVKWNIKEITKNF